MTRFPLSRAAVAAFFCFISAVALHGQAPAISSTKVDALSTDTDGDTKADPLDVIQYTIGISNTGTASATGTTFTDPTPTNTTLIGTSVNVSPVALDDAYPLTVLPNIGINTNTSSEFSVLTNDFKGFVGGNAVAVGDAALTITSVGAATGGGTVVMTTSGADIGKFTYTPAPGFTGTDTFTYTISNTAGGNATSRTATVSITVAGNVIWFVNSTGAAGDGRLATPFNSLSAFQAVNDGVGTAHPAANHFIFLFENGTSYTGPVTLLNNQKLIGQDATASLATIAGVSPSVDSAALPVTNGGNGTFVTLTSASNAVNLGTGNTIRGLTVGNTTGTDINGTAVGSLTVSDVTLNGTGQAFVVSTSGALAVTIDSLSSSSGTNGVNLTGCSGTFTATAGAINGPTGDDFVVNGGTVTVNSAATITNTAGRSVNISNKTASGNVSFTGAISDTGTGILLDNNDGATVSFTGGLSLSTGANVAFTATNGGTVTATQNNSSIVNTLTTTTGTALNVNGTNIGADGLTFRSISAGTGASGPTNGIVLSSTGNSGGLIVTGNGTADSGGIIQRTTGSGILLNDTQNVSLTRMRIDTVGDTAAPAKHGIEATNLRGLTNLVANSTIIDWVSASGNGISVVNTTATLGKLTVSATTFDGTDTNNDGVFMEAQGAGNMELSVENGCVFQQMFGDGVQVNGITGATATVKVTVKNSTFQNAAVLGNGGVGLFPFGNVNFFANIDANTFDTIMRPVTNLGAISITNGLTADADITIKNNTINNIIGARGITMTADGNSVTRILVDNNNIDRLSSTSKHGISINLTDVNLANVPTADVTITNNDLGQGGANFWLTGDGTGNPILLTTQNSSVMRAQMSNNVVSANTSSIIEVMRARAIGTSTLNVIATSNTLTDTSGTHVEFDATTANTATINLDISGNIVPAAGVGVIKLSETAGTLNVEQASSAAVTTANNNATVTITGTPQFATGNPPTPTLPTLPLLFAPSDPENFSFGTPDSVSSAIAWTEAMREAEVNGQRSRIGNPTAAASRGSKADVPSALQQAQLDALVTAARARWEASGLSDAQLAVLDKVTFEVADLSGWYLGEAAGKTVRVDSDAGGNGWFIDATPMEDGEFEGAHRKANIELSTLNIEHSKLAEGRVDLLTTILHEMGHAIGLCDTYSKLQRSSVMYGFLNKGERRLPKRGEANNAVPHEHMTPHFLSSPITIGTLPVGKSVTITYQTTVNGPTLPLGTFEISNQGTVSGSNFANVLTDDPSVGGAADPTVTPVDRPDTTVASINRVTGTPTNAASVSWTVAFADAIINLASGNFTLVNGGLTAPSLTSVTPVGGTPATQWTVTANTGSGSGTLGLNMTNDTGLSHDVTNLTFTGEVYDLDRTPPTVSSVNSTTANGTYKIGDIISIQVNFSETVNVTGTPQITLETGTTDQVVNYTSGSGTSSLTFTYTVQAGDASADLDYQSATALALNGGTITDTVGNVGTLTLASPGAANSLGNNKALVIDGVAPTVASVNSSTANGSYKAGDIISIQVNFSEAVTVTGTPQLTLETGATDRVVNYVSGSGTSALTFTYTVQAGDTSADLDYISTTALALNGGTIRDAALNNATLTLAAPGAANSLGSNKAIVIDTTVPTVTSVNSSTANGSYKAGDAISIQVNFSEAVTVTGTPQLTLETGAIDRVVNYTSGSGTSALTFTYTVQAGDISADLDYLSTTALALNGGTIRDTALNDATLTLPAPGTAGSLGASKNIVIDTTPPAVTSVTSTTTDGSYTTGVVIPVTVTFTEAVTVTGTPQLTLETGAIDRVINYTSGTGTTMLTFTYTVQAGDVSADLDYQSTTALALNGGTIRDAALNSATLTLAAPGGAGSLGASKNIVIDTIAPTVTNVTSTAANATYNIGGVIPVTVTFSETVTVTGTPQLTLETGATDRVVSYTSGTGTNTLTFTYTVQAGDVSADLDYIGTTALALNGGTIRDAALTNASLTLPSPGAAGSLGFNKNIVVNGTAPAVTNVTSAAADGSYATGAIIPVSVTFSSPVNVTGTPQLTLETGTTDRIINYTSGTGTGTLIFTYTVQAGDTSADLDYQSTTALALNGGTIKDGSGTDALLTLPAPGAAGSLGANKAIVIDTTAPTVTSVNSSTANGSYKAGDAISIQVNFSETVTVTGTPQLTLETGATDRVVNYTGGSGTTALTFTYTVQAGDTSADLDYISTTALALNGGTIKDAALNNATLTLAAPGAANSLGSNKSIVIDTTAPTVASVNSSTANGSYKAADIISIQVNFSEAVTVTGTPQLTLETGATDRVVNYVSGSGTSALTFTYTVQAGDTSADLDYISTTALALNGGTIKDAALNNATLTLAAPGAANSLGSNKAIVIDTTAPTVASVNSSTANGNYKASDIISIQVNFSEAVTVTGTPQLTLETGATDRVVNYTGGSGTTALTFTYTVQAGDTSADLDYISTTALALNGGTIRDTALNNATLTLAAPGAANSLGSNKAIVIDTTVPTVASVNSSTANGSYKAGDAISIQVTFSEAVTVTGTPQLTLETGTTDQVANYTSGSGSTTLTFTYTVQAGDVSADLDYLSTTALALSGGTIRDAALNNATLTLAAPGAANSLGNNKAIVIDTTVPTVASVNSSTANGTYKIADIISIQVNFSEAVTVTGTPQLTLETGTTDQAVNYASGSGSTTLTFTYTVQAGDVSADLDYQSTTALALNGGTIRDAALNNASLTLATPGAASSLGNNKAIVIDGIAPTATNVTSTAANGSYTAAAVIPVTVTFSEPVTVTGTPQLTLETGTTDRVVDYTSGSGTATLTFSYTVQAGDVSVDLDYISATALALNGGSIKDSAGNNAALTLPNPGAAGSLGANKDIVLLDVVSLSPTTPTAVEGGATGVYTFTRGGNVGTLTVKFQLDASSTATVTTDYSLGSSGTFTFTPGTGAGTLVIPNSSTSATIALTALTEIPNPAEAAETVKLKIVSDSSYVIGSPADATVTIAPNSFLVTNTNDAAEGSLRQAILNANALAGTDTITFSDGTGGTTDFFDGTQYVITLSSGELVVSSDLTIQGAGEGVLTVSGGTVSRVFSVASGTATIAGLTIADGNGTGTLDSGNGGGVFNQGALTLRHCVVLNNNVGATGQGGGVRNSAGTLTLIESTVAANVAAAGGGVDVIASGTLMVISSTVSGNTSAQSGGGIRIPSGLATVINSTISGNSAALDGGGIHNLSTGLTVYDSTITGNRSDSDGNASGTGGGIGAGGTETLNNTIVAGNLRGPAPEEGQPDTSVPSDIGVGTINTANHNLIGDAGTAGGLTHDSDGNPNAGTNNIVGNSGAGTIPISTILEPALSGNGGPTNTHALVFGSPAINAGKNSLLPADVFDLDGDSNTGEPLPVDQRGAGFTRAFGTVDIGAIEIIDYTPGVTPATTNEDTKSTAGLVITNNASDSGRTTHYQISSVQNGTLFKNDGTTVINSGGFITKAEGAAGLKFLPGANLNSINTAFFGFSVQAADGTAADDALPGMATVSITVTPQPDNPATSGIPDQLLAVGQARALSLTPFFSDADDDALTFSVFSNSAPGIASAAINGSNVNLQGLGAGTTLITIRADDGNGGTVDDAFLVTVGTKQPTAQQIGSAAALNPSTGLFEVFVNVTNTTAFRIDGFRLHVNFNAYKPGFPSLRLQNATSPANSADVYVDYRSPVAVGQTVGVKLEFYTSNRQFPSPFMPILTVEYLGWNTSTLSTVANAAPGTRTAAADDRELLYYYKDTTSKISALYWNGTQWAQSTLTQTPNVSDWLAFDSHYRLVYYQGTDNNLWIAFWTGSQWTQAPITTTGDVAGDVVVDQVWHIVHYRDTSNNVSAVYWNGSQWVQGPLGAPNNNVAGGLAVDSTSHLVYYKGTDNQLWAYYFNGAAWAQAQLSMTADVGGGLTADAGGLVYYRSAANNSAWAVYWDGGQWQQAPLVATASLSDVTTLLSQNVEIYIDTQGQCRALYFANGQWVTSQLGDGGSNLTGGLSTNAGSSLVFARRSDGHIVVLYYKK